MEDHIALCPTCNMRNVNHSECLRCGEQFTKNRKVRKVSCQVKLELLSRKLTQVEQRQLPQGTGESSATTSFVIPPPPTPGTSKMKPQINDSKLFPQNNFKDKFQTIEKRMRIFRYEPQQDDLNWLKESCFNVESTGDIQMDSFISDDDTFVEESLLNSQLKLIRLLRINRRTFSSSPFIDSTYFKGVQRVVFDCPCPTTTLITSLEMFSGVPEIEFGSGFFIPPEEELNGPIANLSVPQNRQFEFVCFTVKCKLVRFNCLSESEQRAVIFKSLFLLQIAVDNLPNLKYCNVSLPHTSRMEQLVDKLISKLAIKGRKSVDYEKNEINYTAGIKQNLFCSQVSEEAPETLPEVELVEIKTKPGNIEKSSTDVNVVPPKMMKESASTSASSAGKSRKSTAAVKKSSPTDKRSRSSNKRSFSP